MRLGSHSEREKNIILRTSMVSETPILLTLSMLLSVTGRSYKLQSQQARVKEITLLLPVCRVILNTLHIPMFKISQPNSK